ncbi:cysteine hydrolase [Microbulbifer halophilus]|uniref:Cysteine hydrolase n=1 Tax=Microbulbifer halophilus TaxID=453963 RepID=A0ABW5EKY2_9GAMM|nr:cysteine hydrolase [Microbulbifer halophilus]MCW8128036.1 cysteine hydrolase [Microbulbifer halophilus]
MKETAMQHPVRDRSAIVFIEFQREWVSEAGRLRRLLVKDDGHFQQAVDRAASLLASARAEGFRVAHAPLDLRRDPNYRLFGGGRDVIGLRRAIPNAGTWTDEGAEFVEPFVPRQDEFVAAGRSGASVLKNSTLDPYLRNNDVRTLFLAGFATHVCVESTLREAHDLGYNAYLVSDACAAFEESQHEHVLDHVVHHFGGAVATDDLIAQMRGAS